MTDKYDVFSLIAPATAPLAPASTLTLILADSIKAQGASDVVALVLAGGSGLGAEASGAVAAYVAVEAFRKKRYGLFIVSAFAFSVYAAFLIYGLSQAKNPAAMQASVMISAIAYLAVAGLQSLRGQAVEDRGASENKLAAAKTALEKDKVALAALRVQAKMDASTGGDGLVHLSIGQNGQNGQSALRPEWLEWMRTYIQAKQAAKEKVTLRGMVAADGCPFTSPTTAKTYLAALNQMEKK